jgi:hypothetical protein
MMPNGTVEPTGSSRPSLSRSTAVALASVAGLMMVCVVGTYLMGALAPPRRLLERQGDVSIYISPADYGPGDGVDLVVEIKQKDAKATAIRQLELLTRDGEEIFATGRVFEVPPWGDTVWGEQQDFEESYPVEIPRRLPPEGLECVLKIDYVEARPIRGGGFRNADVSATVPLTLSVPMD